LMNGELLLNPVKAHQAIRIDDIESPYSQIPSLRQTIYARGMAGPVEAPAATLDNVHLMPSGTDESSRK
ncbi:MAG TPA: N-acetylneuraminic acid synthase, partial [Acidobacteriaceae bacterium]|nr:N-acetylneuraminic acid synthase [Acidobacteriaceae bacterium]